MAGVALELRALRYFVAVKESGSISGAAKRCYVAQPSISSALQQLEDHVGRPLFVRHSRGVRATEAAEQLYPLAKQLLGQASAIKELFADVEHKTTYRLGVVSGLGVSRMSNLLKQFTNVNPHMELTLVPPEQDCDARIINEPTLNEAETFVPMWRESFCVAIPVAHPLSLVSELTLAQLEGIGFIQRTPCEAWPQLQVALDERQINLDIRARIRTIEYAVGLVNAGLGCALLPDYREIVEGREMVMKPIVDLPISRSIGLAFATKSDITQSLTKLVT